MISRAQPLLGTIVEIHCASAAAGAARSALSAVARVHQLMSFHEPDSDLSRLNRLALERPVRVHPWTWKVLRFCQSLHRASGGVFDPAVAAQLVVAGRLPPPSGARPPLEGSIADVFLGADCRVRYLRPLWLDLGGVAKGFALDAAIVALRATGVRSATVNAGGDLRVVGARAQQIYLRNPSIPGQATLIGRLRNGACASSGSYFGGGAPLWAADTSRLGEARPATDARPATGTRHAPRSVTVIARTGMIADALTKVVSLTRDRAHPLLRLHRASAHWIP